jgi:hypothetical protein
MKLILASVMPFVFSLSCASLQQGKADARGTVDLSTRIEFGWEPNLVSPGPAGGYAGDFEPLIGFSIQDESISHEQVERAYRDFDERLASVIRLHRDLNGILDGIRKMDSERQKGVLRAQLTPLAGKLVSLASYSQVARKLAIGTIPPPPQNLENNATSTTSEGSLADAIIDAASKQRALTYDPVLDLVDAAREVDLGKTDGMLRLLEVYSSTIVNANQNESSARRFLQQLLDLWPRYVSINVLVVAGTEPISLASDAFLILDSKSTDFSKFDFATLNGLGGVVVGVDNLGGGFSPETPALVLPCKASETIASSGEVTIVRRKDYVVVAPNTTTEVRFVAVLPQALIQLTSDYNIADKPLLKIVQPDVRRELSEAMPELISTVTLKTRLARATSVDSIALASRPTVDCKLGYCWHLNDGSSRPPRPPR